MHGLLIDQDRVERQRIAGLLQSLGLECNLLDGADENLLHESINAPDFIFAETSKIGFAQELISHLERDRSLQNIPKLVCYTNAPRLDEMAACILAGAVDVLVAPFDRELLHFKLSQAGLLPN